MAKSIPHKAAATLVFGVLAFCGTVSGGPVTITDLGVLPGYADASIGAGVNNAGQVAGVSIYDTRGAAFLYSGGALTNLTAGDIDGGANAINNSGQVAGELATLGGYRAFLYSGGVRTTLGTLGGNYSLAYGINDAGQVVGYSGTSLTSTFIEHAFLYSGGVMTDLGTLGGYLSDATAINDSGQIAGYSVNAQNNTVAFLYSGGTMRSLGTLGGSQSFAYGINASGQVVGYSRNAGDTLILAFLDSGGVMTSLGTLGGGGSFATGINDSGQVVGADYGPNEVVASAFLYSNGVMIDLYSLLPVGSGWSSLNTANSISDSGYITGEGIIDGQAHAYLLDIGSTTPVPEPGSLALVGIVLLAAAVFHLLVPNLPAGGRRFLCRPEAGVRQARL
jgi:probable HAF family extracellular repeat protein